MSLKSNQEVFVCRDSEATWPTTAGLPPSAGVQQNDTAEVVLFVYKKILPTGEYPEKLFEHTWFTPGDCCTIAQQRAAFTRAVWSERYLQKS